MKESFPFPRRGLEELPGRRLCSLMLLISLMGAVPPCLPAAEAEKLADRIARLVARLDDDRLALVGFGRLPPGQDAPADPQATKAEKNGSRGK